MSTVAHVAGTVHSGTGFFPVAKRLFGNIEQKFFKAKNGSFQELSHIGLGACELSKIAASPHGVFGDVAVTKSYEVDSVKVLVQISGRSTFSQGADRIHLKPNAAVIYDPVNPYFLLNKTNVEHLILQIPRFSLDDRTLKRLSQPLFLPSSGDTQSNTFSMLVKTSAENARTLSDGMRTSVGVSLSCFAQGLICGNFQSEMISKIDNASLLLLRERIKNFVQSRLGDSDLSIDEISKRMGCSTRYLHKAFQSEGTTLQRFIWNLRLDQSRAMLADQMNARSSISEIAFNCGFSSSSHFSRLFRQRFEMTPKDVRANGNAYCL